MEKPLYEPNGWKVVMPPIKNPGVWSRLARGARTRLQSWPQPARIALLLTIVVLATSLMGCATTLAPPDTMPSNPALPPNVLPDSPPNYLESALANISKWRKRLNELITTPAN